MYGENNSLGSQNFTVRSLNFLTAVQGVLNLLLFLWFTASLRVMRVRLIQGEEDEVPQVLEGEDRKHMIQCTCTGACAARSKDGRHVSLPKVKGQSQIPPLTERYIEPSDWPRTKLPRPAVKAL